MTGEEVSLPQGLLSLAGMVQEVSITYVQLRRGEKEHYVHKNTYSETSIKDTSEMQSSPLTGPLFCPYDIPHMHMCTVYLHLNPSNKDTFVYTEQFTVVPMQCCPNMRFYSI